MTSKAQFFEEQIKAQKPVRTESLGAVAIINLNTKSIETAEEDLESYWQFWWR